MIKCGNEWLSYWLFISLFLEPLNLTLWEALYKYIVLIRWAIITITIIIIIILNLWLPCLILLQPNHDHNLRHPSSGDSPLMTAARLGRIDVLRHLLGSASYTLFRQPGPRWPTMLSFAMATRCVWVCVCARWDMGAWRDGAFVM